MKTIKPCHSATPFIALVFSIVSCKKETALSNGGNGSAVTNNKAPFAVAGKDTTIMLPADSIHLDGSASFDPDGRITNFLWNQVTGVNAHIVDYHSAKTKALSLKPGIAHFELTVTDNRGISSKDTLMVTVLLPATMTSPLFSNNLTWIFPWYNTLAIPNIYYYVPQDKPIKVFVQRDLNPTWIEVQPIASNSNDRYEYFIETRTDGGGMYTYGSLYIFYYGTDTDDTPNVKVEF